MPSWDEMPDEVQRMIRGAMQLLGESEYVSFWTKMLSNYARAFPGPRPVTLILAYDSDNEDDAGRVAMESVGFGSGTWDGEIALLEAALIQARTMNAKRGQG